MSQLPLATASMIVNTALAEGRRRNLAPLTVAVLDAGGHLIALKREDGSSLMRPKIAEAKAWGVLALGFGARELGRRAEKTPAFFNALIELAEGKMVPVPGGVLIRNEAGEILGAVGVTGDLSDQDEACALAGITSARLIGDTGDK